MGSTQTSTSTMREYGERGGEAHLPVGEGQRKISRPGTVVWMPGPPRGDIDDVEAGEGRR